MPKSAIVRAKTMIAKAKAKLIKTGAKTHHHEMAMTPVRLRTAKRMVANQAIPPN